MSACPPEEQLSAYLDGELPEPDARALAAHLATCPTCAAELAALRRVEQLGRHLAAPEVSDDQWRATWDTIAARVAPAAARPSRRGAGLWRRLRRLRLALVPVAAAALVALALGIWAVGPYNVAQAQVVVESVETAEGYTSMYYHSDEADVTIITLVPADALEDSPSDESRDPL